jgi:hypothetical protein
VTVERDGVVDMQQALVRLDGAAERDAILEGESCAAVGDGVGTLLDGDLLGPPSPGAGLGVPAPPLRRNTGRHPELGFALPCAGIVAAADKGDAVRGDLPPSAATAPVKDPLTAITRTLTPGE